MQVCYSHALFTIHPHLLSHFLSTHAGLSQVAALHTPSPCTPTQPMLLPTASTQPIFPVPQSEFTLIFIHGNIRTCAGCHTYFPKQGSNFADPPFNIAVRHQEEREGIFVPSLRSEKQNMETLMFSCSVFRANGKVHSHRSLYQEMLGTNCLQVTSTYCSETLV